jgi:hypothetical protein
VDGRTERAASDTRDTRGGKSRLQKGATVQQIAHYDEISFVSAALVAHRSHAPCTSIISLCCTPYQR